MVFKQRVCRDECVLECKGREVFDVKCLRFLIVAADLFIRTFGYGPTFVKEMRKKASLANMPVIFYTASYRVPDAKKLAQECGVSQIMHKPAKPEDVLDAVNAALGLSIMSPQRRSTLIDAEMLRLAALTELGLDLVKETRPTKLLQKFLQAVRFILNSTGAGAIVTDAKAPTGCYAALTHKSADLSGPPDPHSAADVLGQLTNWQPMARLTNPAIEPAVLGLAEPIRNLLVAAISLPDARWEPPGSM